MGYKVGRAKKITESLELVDETGATVKEIPASITPDKVVMEFNRRYNAVIAAQKAAQQVADPSDAGAQEVLSLFGDAVLSLLGLVFGDDGAAEILDFYEDAYAEMAVAVFPYIEDVIVPEIEAIRTERLYDFEREGIQVVPSARAVNFTMNRKAIRDLAAKELGLKTARYFYAASLGELREAAAKIGFPCVVKPLMSSSGKGQSLVKGPDELERAWHYGCEGSRGDIRELIIEEFIRFDSEITLLTVTQKDGPTLFCPPIGHVQKGGDYRESFQSPVIAPEHLAEAQRMAAAVTEALTGAGLWGVEFFLSRDNGVYFSELSPRPHDTGMVTLAGTQNLNEFELHLRAVLGIPIPAVTFERMGASAVILSGVETSAPRYGGVEEAVAGDPRTDIRIFGKPSARVNRRMGVVVGYEPHGSSLEALRERVCAAAAKVKVTE